MNYSSPIPTHLINKQVELQKNIQATPRQLLKTLLKKETLKSPIFNEIVDLNHIDMNSLIDDNQLDIYEYFEIATDIIYALSDCLNTKQMCGQTVGDVGPHTSDTSLHKILNRSLQIVKLALEIDETKFQDLNRAQLLKLLKLNYRFTQVLTLEVMLFDTINDKEFYDLLLNDRFLKSEVKGFFYELMSIAISGPNAKARKSKLLETIKLAIQKKDPMAIMQIFRSLNLLGLSKDEFVDIVESSCYLLNHQGLDHSWEQFLKHFIKKRFDIKTNSICSQGE